MVKEIYKVYYHNKIYKSLIDVLCKKYNIINYSLYKDGSINAHDNVDLSNLNLTKIPIKFNIVYGDFNCSFNKLTTLENAPKFVHGDFYCSVNELKSLEGAPEHVRRNFFCDNNFLKSFDGFPKFLSGDFNCRHNKSKLTKKELHNLLPNTFYNRYYF